MKGQPALLSSVLFCARCTAPMYRINAWQGWFYRCAGHYPERKGCGNLVSLADTDVSVSKVLALSDEPWKEYRLIEGENHDIELADIALRLRDLPDRELSRQDEQAERERLWAEEDRLTELNKHARPDRWEEVETSETVGQHWASLDFDGKRAMLLEHVKIYAESAGPELRIESHLFRLRRIGPSYTVTSELSADRKQSRHKIAGLWRSPA